jgi:hypothetical protein
MSESVTDKLERLGAEAESRAKGSMSEEVSSYWRGLADGYRQARSIIQPRHSSMCLLMEDHDGNCIIPT